MDNGLLERKDKTKQRKKDFVRRPFIGYFKVRVFDFWKEFLTFGVLDTLQRFFYIHAPFKLH